jgi:hypothetical protein
MYEVCAASIRLLAVRTYERYVEEGSDLVTYKLGEHVSRCQAKNHT